MSEDTEDKIKHALGIEAEPAAPTDQDDELPEGKLTERQERFCQQYILHGNAARAAREAGYSHDNARKIGSENLTKPDISARIEVLRKPILERYHMSKERILHELSVIAQSNVLDIATVNSDGHMVIDMRDMTREQAAAIAQVEVTHLPPIEEADGSFTPVLKTKVKMWDKMAALEKLAKQHGILDDKVEVTHKGLPETDPVALARQMAFMLEKGAREKK